MEIDVLIMKYKTTKALLDVDREFYIKQGEYLSARQAKAKIVLIDEFIEDLIKLNEANN
jgi:hypothetical protein